MLLQCNSDLSKLSIFSSDHSIAKRSINSNEEKSKQVDIQPKIENDNKSKQFDTVQGVDNNVAPIPEKNDQNEEPPDEIESKKNVQDSEQNESKNMESVNVKFEHAANSPYSCLTNSIEMKRIGKAQDGSLEFNFEVSHFFLNEYMYLWLLILL